VPDSYTPADYDDLWHAIVCVRNQYPRTTGDCPTDEIVAVIIASGWRPTR
jgi:hypothetical protein